MKNNDVIRHKNTIFLDLDGCINSELFCKTEEFKLKRADRTEGQIAHLRRDLWSDLVEVLKDFVLKVDAEIVISSTWRQNTTLEEFREVFNDWGIGDRIIDVTPIIRYKGSLRGNEVYVWLQENRPTDFTRYVIFDDDSDFLYWQRNNLFLVDGFCGLTHNVTYRAERFLNSLK